LGLALVLQVGGRYPAWVAVVMFLVFTAVVAGRYVRKQELPCNCFGGKGMITKMTIARNVALVALAVVGTLNA
jgi:hypothetical protein